MTPAERRRAIVWLRRFGRRRPLGSFAHHHRSRVRGRGLTFEEVRPFQSGDDVRSIDWKVSARRAAPYVKLFAAEKERTVWVVLDLTPSMVVLPEKREAAVDIATLLLLAAGCGGDRAGLITFGPTDETLPARRGSRHAFRAVRTLQEIASGCEEGTASYPAGHSSLNSFRRSLVRLARVARSDALVFCVSDLEFDLPSEVVVSLSRWETYLVSVTSLLEIAPPRIGLARLRDVETGQVARVDTSSEAFRRGLEQKWSARRASLEACLMQHGVGHLALMAGPGAVEGLMRWLEDRQRTRGTVTFLEGKRGNLHTLF